MNTKINDKVFEQFPVLESNRLIFRAFEYADVPKLFGMRSNDEVMKYLDTYYHQSEADSRLMIEGIHQSFLKKEGINWVIEEKDSGDFVGYIGFWRMMKENVRAEIGYALHPDFWNCGYMTETGRIILEFGFNSLHLHSVEANVNKENQRSMKLLEKLGFVKEAHFRENYFYNGEFIDSIIYSLLETDFNQKP